MPVSQPFRRKLLVIAAFCALVLFVVLPAVAVSYLFTADLRPLVQHLAGQSLGREVSIGDLRLAWGRTLKLEVRDLRVANAEWSQWPDMLRVGRLTAVVYWPALLKGVVQYDVLRLEGSELYLDRREDGRRNWRFSDDPSSASAAASAGLALVPANRRQFPDVKDLLLRDLFIVYRSQGRRDIRVGLDQAELKAPAADRPSHLVATGAYNDIPLKLEVDGGSTSEMRDASKPYPAAFTATTSAARLDFKGAIQEPLDFDGVDGAFTFDSGDFAAVLKLFGYERPLAFPVRFDAKLTRDGDRWALDDLKGNFGDSAMAGRFVLEEGGRGGADAATVDVSLDRFDVETLAQGIAEPDTAGRTAESFRPEDKPAVTLQARIAAETVTFGKLAAQDLRLDGALTPGALTLNQLAMRLAGGAVTARGAIRGDGPTEALADLDLAYDGGDVAELARLSGLEGEPISGKLDGRLTGKMRGETAKAALGAADAQAVFAMRGGTMARSLLEKVSLDLRALFRRNDATAQVQCLLAVVEAKSGTARLQPVALQTDAVHLSGGGAVDMATGQIDLLLRSDPKTSSGLALDWPLHVSGALPSPSVTPRPGAGPAWLNGPQPLPEGLGGELRALAQGTGCAQ